jgi:hypothetical protein
MTDYKKRVDILRRMIETFVVPKYSDIEDIIISSDFFRGMRRYGVIVLTKHIADYPVQNKIIGEIETLFKMAALNEKQINGRDYIDVSFA